MMEQTSTKWAPWYLVPANDKLFGRLATFKILIARLGKGVSLKPRTLDPKIAELAAQDSTCRNRSCMAAKRRLGSRLCENSTRYNHTRNFEPCGHAQSEKRKNSSLARHYDQIRFRFYTAWVIFDVSSERRPLPQFPRKPTFACAAISVATGHEETHAPQESERVTGSRRW